MGIELSLLWAVSTLCQATSWTLNSGSNALGMPLANFKAIGKTIYTITWTPKTPYTLPYPDTLVLSINATIRLVVMSAQSFCYRGQDNYPYRPNTSPKIRISTMPTKTRDCSMNDRTPCRIVSESGVDDTSIRCSPCPLQCLLSSLQQDPSSLRKAPLLDAYTHCNRSAPFLDVEPYGWLL